MRSLFILSLSGDNFFVRAIIDMHGRIKLLMYVYKLVIFLGNVTPLNSRIAFTNHSNTLDRHPYPFGSLRRVYSTYDQNFDYEIRRDH